MKYFFVIIFFYYIQLVKADINYCEKSPVTLNSKEDWEKYEILSWHNCVGELSQNYENKKIWKSIFKNGLPNGYGTVQYEYWDGYYEGFFLDGKMHGKGQYIKSDGNKLYLKCIYNNCYDLKLDKSEYKNQRLTNLEAISRSKKKSVINSRLITKNVLDNQFDINVTSDTFNVRNILPKSLVSPVNNNIINNRIKDSVSKNIKSMTDKTFKY